MENHILRNGILGGVAVVGYFALLYGLGREVFIHPVGQWASMALYLGFMYWAARADDALYGVERAFRHQVRAPFAVFILINLAYWLFYYGLHLADPELVRMELLAQKATVEAQLARGAGDPQWANQLREGLAEIEKALAHPVQPLGPILLRFGMGAVGGFALAALTVFFRRTFR